jgi:hypothetical protein
MFYTIGFVYSYSHCHACDLVYLNGEKSISCLLVVPMHMYNREF